MIQAIKVLVVEDSDDDTQLAMKTLRRGGFEPTWRRVQDASALRAALTQEPWDAVLSDFRIPGFSGVDALRIFRSFDLDIPFIFVSGTIGEEIAVEAMKAGASDYVMKANLPRLPAVMERELSQAAIRAEHRQAEVDLRRYESQLRHVQKMESVGTLAGGIAHDFNNILGAILGNVGLALEMLGEEHEAVHHLSEIRKASVRARDLVRQILAFSRRQSQELLTQPLRPLVEETRTLLRATLPAGVELDLGLTDAPLYVHADANQVQQALMNLCTNAWHALMGSAGRIAIGLDEVDLDTSGAQRLGGLTAGRYAHLWVSDDGIGMDSATAERVFEPFFTTKPVGQGTGLGLSVVHGIMASHRGAVAVDSEPGRGSTFHLYFPLVDAPAGATSVAVPTAPAAPVRGCGEHVLYVDDDEAMVVLATQLLQRAGFRVSGFTVPHDALAAVREQPASFDCVVTDYNMPECSGLDLARELAQVHPSLPVVIISGYLTDDLRAQARELGVRGLVEKQHSFEELRALVGHIVAER